MSSIMSRMVSVILVNYQGMPHLETCLRSVLAQSYSNYEVIVVDNSSTDGSAEWIAGHFPQVRLVRSTANLGYAGGIARGMEFARGDFIAPCNIDTEVDRDWLKNMAEFMEAHPGVGAVSPKSILFDRRDTVSCLGLDIHFSGIAHSRGKYAPDDGHYRDPIRVSGISGCSYLIRRDVFERAGGAPQECFMGNDDVVLSWILNLMGQEMYCVPAAVIYHKYSAKTSPEMFALLERNRIAIVLSVLKGSTLALLAVPYLLIELCVMGYCLTKGTRYLQAKLRAYRAVARDRAAIRERHSRLQSIREVSDWRLLGRLKFGLNLSKIRQIWRD